MCSSTAEWNMVGVHMDRDGNNSANVNAMMWITMFQSSVTEGDCGPFPHLVHTELLTMLPEVWPLLTVLTPYIPAVTEKKKKKNIQGILWPYCPLFRSIENYSFPHSAYSEQLTETGKPFSGRHWLEMDFCWFHGTYHSYALPVCGHWMQKALRRKSLFLPRTTLNNS